MRHEFLIQIEQSFHDCHKHNCENIWLLDDIIQTRLDIFCGDVVDIHWDSPYSGHSSGSPQHVFGGKFGEAFENYHLIPALLVTLHKVDLLSTETSICNCHYC